MNVARQALENPDQPLRLVTQGKGFRARKPLVRNPRIGPWSVGRDVELAEVPPESFGFLYDQLVVSSPHAGKGRFHVGVSYEDFYGEVVTTNRQFYVSRRRVVAPPIGYLYAYDFDPQAGHVCLGAERFAAERDGGTAMMVAWALFVQTLFDEQPGLRKFYMHVPEFNFAQFSHGFLRTDRHGRERGYYEQEGVLRNHVFYDGELHDLRYLSVSRETWFKPRIQRMIEREVRA
jgi:RimJ/RimL family protein N-acetyltransferase